MGWGRDAPKSPKDWKKPEPSKPESKTKKKPASRSGFESYAEKGLAEEFISHDGSPDMWKYLQSREDEPQPEVNPSRFGRTPLSILVDRRFTWATKGVYSYLATIPPNGDGWRELHRGRGEREINMDHGTFGRAIHILIMYGYIKKGSGRYSKHYRLMLDDLLGVKSK